MDIASGSTNNGGNIHQWTTYNLASQQWSFDLVDAGSRVANNRLEFATDKFAFDVFPNPTDRKDPVRITFTRHLDKGSEIRILNMSGKVIFISEVSGSEIRINKNQLESGLLLIELQSSGHQYMKKLLVK